MIKPICKRLGLSFSVQLLESILRVEPLYYVLLEGGFVEDLTWFRSFSRALNKMCQSLVRELEGWGFKLSVAQGKLNNSAV